MHISEADIQQLIQNPSAGSRAEVATKICQGYSEGAFTGREREIAIEIMRLLLRDAAAKVRETLAQELSTHLDVPHDIIWSLATDAVDDVAEIVLSQSPVLSEEELVSLIHAMDNMKRMQSIARRPSISAGVSDALARNGDAAVVKTLLANQGAAIHEPTLERLMEGYDYDESVLEAMVCRGGLPYATAEKLFAMVADHLKKDLTKRYRLSRHVLDEATTNAREVAVMEFLSPWMSQQDVVELVAGMHRAKRLTESVIIRSLCGGNLRFFEAALAKRADVTVANARMLLMDAGNRGFDALYDAAAMPDSFRDAVRVFFKIAQKETSGGNYHHDHFLQRMLERLADEGHEQSIANMSTLMAILGRSIHDVPKLH